VAAAEHVNWLIEPQSGWRQHSWHLIGKWRRQAMIKENDWFEFVVVVIIVPIKWG
jgi:hypothetical protein